jgi:hypothetical protein
MQKALDGLPYVVLVQGDTMRDVIISSRGLLAPPKKVAESICGVHNALYCKGDRFVLCRAASQGG